MTATRPPRVIGIDQSYTGFGFCVDGESKKRVFPASRYNGDDIKRLAAIREWFTTWLTLQGKMPVDLVAMEGYASNSKYGRESSGELGAVVKLAIYDVFGKAPLIVPPNSLKKFVTGSGGAKKNTMIMHVFKQWGVEFSDDNQADAFSLEKFGEAYLAATAGDPGVLGYYKYQIEAVEAVLKPK